MSDFKVEIPVTCARTGKLERRQMTLNEVVEYQQALTLKRELSEQVQSMLANLPVEAPDLVVMFRNQVVVLDTVLPGKDATVLRMLHDLTQSPVFPEVEVPPRNKRANSGKRATVPSDGSE